MAAHPTGAEMRAAHRHTRPGQTRRYAIVSDRATQAQYIWEPDSDAWYGPFATRWDAELTLAHWRAERLRAARRMTGHDSHAGATTRAAQLGHDLGRWVPLPGGTALCRCRRCGLRVLDVGYTAGGSACAWAARPLSDCSPPWAPEDDGRRTHRAGRPPRVVRGRRCPRR
jgi:hypothetical protein